jgi:hypothetical protein
VVLPAGVDVQHVARQQAAPGEPLGLDHALDVGGRDQLARPQRRASAEKTARIQQHRAGDDRRHLVDAELQERRIGARLDLTLCETAVVARPVGGKVALPVPDLGQLREMADRVHLRALRGGLAAHGFAVEGMARGRQARGRAEVVLERHAERRDRHGL